jgi:hypothetical protein
MEGSGFRREGGKVEGMGSKEMRNKVKMMGRVLGCFRMEHG